MEIGTHPSLQAFELPYLDAASGKSLEVHQGSLDPQARTLERVVTDPHSCQLLGNSEAVRVTVDLKVRSPDRHVPG
jgi:hypothetical protein